MENNRSVQGSSRRGCGCSFRRDQQGRYSWFNQLRDLSHSLRRSWSVHHYRGSRWKASYHSESIWTFPRSKSAESINRRGLCLVVASRKLGDSRPEDCEFTFRRGQKCYLDKPGKDNSPSALPRCPK